MGWKLCGFGLGANPFFSITCFGAGCETRVFKDTSCEDPASVSLQNPDGVRWPDSSSPQVPGNNRQWHNDLVQDQDWWYSCCNSDCMGWSSAETHAGRSVSCVPGNAQCGYHRNFFVTGRTWDAKKVKIETRRCWHLWKCAISSSGMSQFRKRKFQSVFASITV